MPVVSEMNAREAINSALDDKGWLLADGATGTNLFAAGLPPGEPPELWNEQAPALIAELTKQSLLAGAELVLTNSFGCNASRLKLHGAADKTAALARQSAEIAKNAAESIGVRAIVAGSVGPTGELMRPMGGLTPETAREIFGEQIDGLRAGGADVIWIETMSDLQEMMAAAEAAAAAGMEWCGTMSFDSAGRTMMGVTPSQTAGWAAGLERQPAGIGANCGAGAADLVRTILEIAAADPGIPVIAKGNAGIPKYVHGEVHYDGSPELMGDYAVLARNAGASVIGGCCGTGPGHLRKMRERLESAPPGPPPELAEITAGLGPFTGSANTEKSKRNRRRRRR